jgi:hypothetical protein
VDLSGLSKAGRHESHHTRSAAEIVKTVPAGKLMSTRECVDGYHGVELAEEDRHKTAFATEFGLVLVGVEDPLGPLGGLTLQQEGGSLLCAS